VERNSLGTLRPQAIADPLEQRRIVPGHSAEDGQISRTRLKLAGNNLNQRALAGAIRANQSGEAGSDFELTLFSPMTMRTNGLIREPGRRDSFGFDPFLDDPHSGG